MDSLAFCFAFLFLFCNPAALLERPCKPTDLFLLSLISRARMTAGLIDGNSPLSAANRMTSGRSTIDM